MKHRYAEALRPSTTIMQMSGPAGAPWPDGTHGEVISPSGRRAYLASRAAQLAGRTQRWATDLASRAESPVQSERGRISGRKGADAWFLIADTFEAYLTAHGGWPPQAPEASRDVEQLLMLQGADLEASRRRERDLEAKVIRLEKDRDELLGTIESMSRIIATMSRVSQSPPQADH